MPVHHLAFRTDAIDPLVRFYRTVFGLPEVRDARPRAVWLGLGSAPGSVEAHGAVLMIEKREPGETSRSFDQELVAFAGTEDEKTRVRDAARELGVYDGETAHTVYLRDPDGRRVGISTYPLPPG